MCICKGLKKTTKQTKKMLNFSITFWELSTGNAASARGLTGTWHCLAPLGLIRAAWALFCCWMCLGLFFLGELPTAGRRE